MAPSRGTAARSRNFSHSRRHQVPRSGVREGSPSAVISATRASCGKPSWAHGRIGRAVVHDCRDEALGVSVGPRIATSSCGGGSGTWRRRRCMVCARPHRRGSRTLGHPRDPSHAARVGRSSLLRVSELGGSSPSWCLMHRGRVAPSRRLTPAAPDAARAAIIRIARGAGEPGR
jgi:hypothetical protein